MRDDASKLEPDAMELSRPGRTGVALPASGVAGVDPPPPELLRDGLRLPELSQLDVVRHFTRLSQLNWSIDTHMYPLGSCTMKLNPKVNDAIAALPGFAEAHPMQPADDVQGALAVMYGLQAQLAEITGMAGASLAPMAGAQGELAGIRVIKAYLDANGGEKRTRVLVPDSAHGTNPATASMAGFDVVSVRSRPDGDMDLDALRDALEHHGHAVAALMITLPSTLGLFDRNIAEIARLVHAHGAQMYGDGANLNAMLGQVKPGDLGFDVMHINLHKTFSQPHGGGGPGAGPIAVKPHLLDYLPTPHVVLPGGRMQEAGGRGALPPYMHQQSAAADPSLFPPASDSPPPSARYALHTPQHTIGRMGAFHGNFGVLVRAYAYIRCLGPDGLRAISEAAVLNANYVQARLRDAYDLAHDRTCMHEVVFSGARQKAQGARTLDIAKRMIDYGYHPPTIYFPLVVEEALMVEPTESETKETLDAFCDAMLRIAEEARTQPELLREAPHATPLRRLDEAAAARRPRLHW